MWGAFTGERHPSIEAEIARQQELETAVKKARFEQVKARREAELRALQEAPCPTSATHG